MIVSIVGILQIVISMRLVISSSRHIRKRKISRIPNSPLREGRIQTDVEEEAHVVWNLVKRQGPPMVRRVTVDKVIVYPSIFILKVT